MKKFAVLSAVGALAFVSGYWVATVNERSNTAAVQFMDTFTVLAYTHKGESTSAIQILRTKADALLVESEKYNWKKLVNDQTAVNAKWISAYSKLRKNLPSEDHESKLEEFQSENLEFERKLKEILDRN